MKNKINEMIELVNNGYSDPLLTYIQLKELSDLINKSLKDIQDKAIIEAQNYGQKSFEFHNAKIELRAGAGTWKFEGYQKYDTVKNELKSIEENMKNSYKMSLKSQLLVDGDEVIPPAQYIGGKDTIAISFKKDGK